MNKYNPRLKESMAEEGATIASDMSFRPSWDEATIRFAAEMEDVWDNIDHALAGERKTLDSETGDVVWVKRQPSLINERGRDELHLYWSGLINKIVAFSALREEDVNDEILQIKMDVIFLIGLEKTTEYEINEGSLDTIADVVCEPIFHVLRAAQSGGLRDMFSMIRKETISQPQSAPEPGGLLSFLPWRSRKR